MSSINDIDLDELSIVYIHHLGTNSDGNNIYHLFYSARPEDVFGGGWADKPACLIPNTDMIPASPLFDSVERMVTPFRFDLAQDSCCFSMQDCRDGCVALASENLDEAEEYPEPIRIVIPYGSRKDDVESLLARRGILTDPV